MFQYQTFYNLFVLNKFYLGNILNKHIPLRNSVTNPIQSMKWMLET